MRVGLGMRMGVVVVVVLGGLGRRGPHCHTAGTRREIGSGRAMGVGARGGGLTANDGGRGSSRGSGGHHESRAGEEEAIKQGTGAVESGIGDEGTEKWMRKMIINGRSSGGS